MNYLVSWDMVVEAVSPEDAALQCKAMLQDPDNTASIFRTKNERTGEVVRVDVEFDPPVAFDT